MVSDRLFRCTALGFDHRRNPKPKPAASVGGKQFFPGPLFFQGDRLRGADLGGQENFLVAVAPGVDHFGDHLGVELENFRRCLDALSVAFAFCPVDCDLHAVSAYRLLDTNQVIVSQNEFKKFIAPSTLSSQRPRPSPFFIEIYLGVLCALCARHSLIRSSFMAKFQKCLARLFAESPRRKTASSPKDGRSSDK